jgi:hypothetical protein
MRLTDIARDYTDRTPKLADLRSPLGAMRLHFAESLEVAAEAGENE